MLCTPTTIRHLFVPVACFVMMCSVPVACAQEEAEPVQVMVMQTDTKLMLDEKLVGKAEKGEVLTATLQQSGWMWIPERDGWIQESRVAPISKALSQLDREIKRNPSAELLEQRALGKIAIGELDGAIEDLNKALEKNDKKPSILINRGFAWRKGQNPELAIQDFSLAIRMAPKDPAPLNHRAIVYLDQNKLKEALADVKAALKLNDDFADAYMTRGMIFRRQNSRRTAKEDFTRVIKMKPTSAAAYFNRGIVLEAERKESDAIKDYKKAVALNPNYAEAHNNLAWILATTKSEKTRDPETALKSAMKANQLTGFNDWNFLDTLGMAHISAESPQLAEKWFRKAHKLAPKEERKAIDKHISMATEMKKMK